MKQYLHNSDELFESPQYGWEQMQFLLEKNLPQKETNRSAVPLLTIFIAASLLILFLLSSLVITNTGRYFNWGVKGNSQFLAQNNVLSATDQVPAATMLTLNNEAIQPFHSAGDKAQANNIAANGPLTGNHAAILSFFPATAMPYRENDKAWSNSLGSITNTTIKAVAYTAENIPSADSSKPAAKNKPQRKGSWDLLAGLGVNASIGEKQNLQPYPMATLRYNVNKKLFVALGAAVASPVSVSSKGISKTVLLNDSARNVNFYNNVKHYSRLSYVDIPLTAGVKIGKRFAVQAGVQASVLLDSKTTTAIDKYDFQMNMSTDFPGTLLTSAPAVSEENYTVKARKIDYRFTGGIQYTVNKASFHLNYQYAPKAALSGEHVSRAKNELISVGVQFKLK